MRGILTDERCDKIKVEIVDLFEECGIDAFPIDCFKICRESYYRLRPYSLLSTDKRTEAFSISNDGFSRVECDAATGMNYYAIYYNDGKAPRRIRWTIFHEIGHIVLGHHDHIDDSLHYIEEAEANFFAKYAIAPPPLIHMAMCETPYDIYRLFETSDSASYYALAYYQKWLAFGPKSYLDFERKLLALFHLAAA